jgi:hypothetical protein
MATGRISANKLVLEYDSGLAEPSQTTSTITTSEDGNTVFSNNVQVGQDSMGQMTAGIVAFTGLAVQAGGMPSSLSTLSREDCTDLTDPCTLTLSGSGSGVYSVGITGNSTSEVGLSGHSMSDAWK